MDDLVEGALEEGRVDRGKGLHAVGGKPRGEGHGMLFGQPDIERAMRKRLLERVDAGAGRHRGGDGDDLVVLLGLGDQAVGEHLGEGRDVGLGLVLDAGYHLELRNAVIPVGRFLRRGIALALHRDDVDQDGTFGPVVPDVAQDRQQMVEIVSVHRTDIEEAELLEQRPAGHQPAGVFLRAFHALLDGARDLSAIWWATSRSPR